MYCICISGTIITIQFRLYAGLDIAYIAIRHVIDIISVYSSPVLFLFPTSLASSYLISSGMASRRSPVISGPRTRPRRPALHLIVANPDSGSDTSGEDGPSVVPSVAPTGGNNTHASNPHSVGGPAEPPSPSSPPVLTEPPRRRHEGLPMLPPRPRQTAASQVMATMPTATPTPPPVTTMASPLTNVRLAVTVDNENFSVVDVSSMASSEAIMERIFSKVMSDESMLIIEAFH